MRRVLTFLLTAALFIGLAWLVAELPGHVTAELGGTTVEASTPVLLVALDRKTHV